MAKPSRTIRTKPGSKKMLTSFSIKMKNKLQRSAQRLKSRQDAFLARRPHRSFRQTRRRDYVVRPSLPAYTVFTFGVIQLLRSNRRPLLTLIGVFSLLYLALGGLTSQQTYAEAQDLLQESGTDVFEGSWGRVGEASLLFLTAFASGPSQAGSVEQVYLGFTTLLAWLATVWFLRETLAGHAPRARDAVYNSGSPVVPTLILFFVLLLQFIPVGLLAIAYAGLTSVGLATSGFGAMMFGITALLVTSLVLYWASATFIALVIVTLPGMYPLKALKAAGDLVVGIRLVVMYRLLWLLLLTGLAWAAVLVPVIIVDTWLKSAIAWYAEIPVVAIVVSAMSVATVVWSSAYIYMLYRRLVEDGAKRSQ
jgi:hypothetical protein